MLFGSSGAIPVAASSVLVLSLFFPLLNPKKLLIIFLMDFGLAAAFSPPPGVLGVAAGALAMGEGEVTDFTLDEEDDGEVGGGP